MLKISQIYDKFLILFRKNFFTNHKKETQTDSEYCASLFFGLLDKNHDMVDIKCLLPDVTDKSSDQILSIAEKYAELLVIINTEAFNKKIYEILNKNKNIDNHKEVLLIDNIISFWNVLYEEESKKQFSKYKLSQPMIKPSEAFRIK
jgi:hypothetical protein